MTIQFRQAQVEDIDELVRLEKLAFTSPWTKAAFRNEFLLNQHAYYLLAILEEKIVGYAGIWLILDEGHITNIAIDPAYQGKSYGEALLRELMAHSAQKGARHFTLEVRETNQIAQNLYQKLNFQKGALRKNYYPDNGENALVMWVNLS